MGKFLILAVLVSVCAIVTSSDCSSKETCSKCIQTPNCMWCGKPGNFSTENSSLLRCKERSGQLNIWREACGQRHIVEPENYYEVLQNVELAEAGILAGTSGSGSGFYGGRAVQMKPQKSAMKLRIRESQSMSITYRQAEDYPVDLYYLMDLSNSMEDDKASLSALGQQLAEEMQKITRNFRLGFGSFVDKVVMPYVSTVPEKLNAPCDGCARPYGFRNALKMTSDSQQFVERVKSAPVSGNLDAPEGGFDAIMQAIKCKDAIGWREAARHLLLFSTDAGFHYAGDGKLGGIVKPNDGQCHLDQEGYYTHSKILDYPSVSQINQVVKEENINIIFAVTSEQSSVYQKLSYMIEGSSAGTLAANSSNIVNLVKEEYSKITSKVEMKDNATAPVYVKYYSKCKNLDGPEIETAVCDNIRVGDEVEFRAEITVDKCPEDRNLWKQTIAISPVALSDTLLIDLEMVCECECEKPGYPGNTPRAEQCSSIGTYQCGVCKCPEGFRGRKCECGSETPWGSMGVIDETSCRADNYSKICSGQGTCVCGECKCNERDNADQVISGVFCECSNFLCERHNGKICSGPDHGECLCNKCKCKPGWTGNACECQNSTSNCLNPNTGDICSNQGMCECNQCSCLDTEGGRYSGKWCEDCPTCKAKCAVYKDCVQCQAFGTGALSEEECAANCTLFNVTKYNSVKVENETESVCSFYDEEECRFRFVYGYGHNKEPYVRVQRTLECPPKLDILGIILGVIGAIVGVGLLLLLMWKFLTTIHDRREYARFEKERAMTKWDTGENPLYQQATSTFKNPIYGGK